MKPEGSQPEEGPQAQPGGPPEGVRWSNEVRDAYDQTTLDYLDRDFY